MFTSARPLFASGFSPRLEGALARRAARRPEPRLVRQEPESSEVGVALLREDAGEVGLDPRRPGEAGVVAEDAQRDAIRREPPQGLLIRVQSLLREPERAAAPSDAEGRRERVEA